MSVASEIAGSSGRSRSKRPTISAAKCCASDAEPPLPQARILPSASRHSVSTSAARAISGASAPAASCLSCALSANCARMRSTGSMTGPKLSKRCDCSNESPRPTVRSSIGRQSDSASRRCCAASRCARDRAHRGGSRRSGTAAARRSPRDRCPAAAIIRARLAAVMLAAAPPKSRRVRSRTSTKTSVSPSRGNEIELAAAAAQVALDDREAAARKEFGGESPRRALRRCARAVGIRLSSTHVGRHDESGAELQQRRLRARTAATASSDRCPVAPSSSSLSGGPSANACATESASMPSA